MKVEFFTDAQAASRANTDSLAAVLVKPVKNGTFFEVDRYNANLEVASAAVAEIYARWKTQLPLLKALARTEIPHTIACSCPSRDNSSHTVIDFICGKSMEDGWKQFLADLLSRPDSWDLPHGLETTPCAVTGELASSHI